MNETAARRLPTKVMLTAYLKNANGAYVSGTNETTSLDRGEGFLRLHHPDNGGTVMLVDFADILFVTHPQEIA